MTTRSPLFLRWVFGLVPLLLIALGCGHAMESTGYAATPEEAAPADAMQDADESMFSGEAEAYAKSAPAPMVASEPSASSGGVAPARTEAPEAPRTQSPVSDTGAAHTAAVQAGTARGPLLIYQAVLTLAVFELRQAMDRIEKLAQDAGGYLVERGDQSITVRIPTQKFDGALESVAAHGDELHREVSATDVTEQYHDLAIRLDNAVTMRGRLVALLDKAQNVQEALSVERELERVAGEIELLKGKLQRLRELIAFSTITVRFEARPVDKIGTHRSLPFPWLQDLGLPQLMEL